MYRKQQSQFVKKQNNDLWLLHSLQKLNFRHFATIQNDVVRSKRIDCENAHNREIRKKQRSKFWNDRWLWLRYCDRVFRFCWKIRKNVDRTWYEMTRRRTNSRKQRELCSCWALLINLNDKYECNVVVDENLMTFDMCSSLIETKIWCWKKKKKKMAEKNVFNKKFFLNNKN